MAVFEAEAYECLAFDYPEFRSHVHRWHPYFEPLPKLVFGEVIRIVLLEQKAVFGIGLCQGALLGALLKRLAATGRRVLRFGR